MKQKNRFRLMKRACLIMTFLLFFGLSAFIMNPIKQASATNYSNVNFVFEFNEETGAFEKIKLSFTYSSANSAVANGDWGIGIFTRDFEDGNAVQAALDAGFDGSFIKTAYNAVNYNPERCAPPTWTLEQCATTSFANDKRAWAELPVAYVRGPGGWQKTATITISDITFDMTNVKLDPGKTYYVHILMNNGKCWFIESSGCKGYTGNTFTLSEIYEELEKTHTHTYGELHAAKPATCDTPGNIAYYECSCGRCFDENKESVDNVEIAPLGHDWSVSEKSGKIIAVCNTEKSHTAEFTPIVNNAPFTGYAYKESTYISTGWTGNYSNLPTPVLTYWKDGVLTSASEGAASEGAAPAAAGTYSVKFSFGDVSVTKDFKIIEVSADDGFEESEINYADGYLRFNTPATADILIPIYPSDKSFGITQYALEGSYLNLTQELLVTKFSYDCYSLDGGKTWKKDSEITSKDVGKWFSKNVNILLANGYGSSRKLADEAEVYYIGPIHARPKAITLKPDYYSCRDNYALTNGQWTLVTNDKVPARPDFSMFEFALNSAVGLEFSLNCSDEKAQPFASIDEVTGYGVWPESGGVFVPSLIKNGTKEKTQKASVLYRIAPKQDSVTLEYYPASKVKKLSIVSAQKTPKVKVNYTKEIIKLKTGMTMFFGAAIPGCIAGNPAESDPSFTLINPELYTSYTTKASLDNGAIFNIGKEQAKVALSLAPYITKDRNTLLIWQTATAKKPASAVQTIVLAARGADIATAELTVKTGKAVLSKDRKYEIFNPVKNKWSASIPKFTETVLIPIRSKSTAKGGKECDTTFAASYEGYIKLYYGVYDTKRNRYGVVCAITGPTESAIDALYLSTHGSVSP